MRYIIAPLGCKVNQYESEAMELILRARGHEKAEKGELSRDYKSLLQQLVQNSKGDRLEYETVCEKGPDHDKTFVMRVTLNGNTVGTGEGRTKREAEQKAAHEALKLFGEEKD